MSEDLATDTLERIQLFATYKDDWEQGHRGISTQVADTATKLALRVGPELVFATPFDGCIILVRRVNEPVKGHPHGREVEVRPGGLMSLVADFEVEDGEDDDYDQPLDLEKAAAWLLADTRG